MRRRGQFGSSSRRSPASPFHTASLLVAPEQLGEARRGTVVRLDYGGYCCVLGVLPRSNETWGLGPGTKIRCRWTHLTAVGRAPGGRDGAVVEVPVASSGPPSLLYVTMEVRLLSSGRARAGRTRRGGSRGPRS
ncbi:hypothetical protein Taro_045601 [Colocasia esculenta]|uniref:Uncharacterized protein n=1 Tax=Colocasia esculenta TaxID=4460 RepID=A0A843WPX3_COLES|nr:hypothetical protein [Colocasia esculenta]